MTGRKRKEASSKRKSKQRSFQVGQRVQIDGYGRGKVIAVEARRGGRYSDIWIRPDDSAVLEIGLPYKKHGLIEPA